MLRDDKETTSETNLRCQTKYNTRAYHSFCVLEEITPQTRANEILGSNYICVWRTTHRLFEFLQEELLNSPEEAFIGHVYLPSYNGVSERRPSIIIDNGSR